MLTDEDIEEIMNSGDRLPTELWDSGFGDSVMGDPTFVGDRVVDGEVD